MIISKWAGQGDGSVVPLFLTAKYACDNIEMGDTICQDKRGRKVAAEFTILCFEGLTVSKFLKIMKIGKSAD